VNPAVFALFSLTVTSVMLAAILLIAWAGFGRPRHALTWSLAYGVATVEWLVNLVAITAWPGNAFARPVMLTLAAIVTLLLTIGFRQRRDLKPRLLPLGLFSGATVAVGLLANMLERGGPIDRATLPLFLAFMQVISATTLVGRGTKANPAERAAFAVLIVSALFDFAVGMLALVQGPGASPAEIAAYNAMLLFGTPTAFTAIGIFSVFLLAADMSEKMRRLTILDPLTGVLNRRGLEQAAKAAIANALRFDQPMSVVMIDLDRFKAINDGFGHTAGDRVLQRFALRVADAIRAGDLFGRIGGEEFALILINTPAASAMDVTERIRAEVERLDTGTDGLGLTASFGVTGLGRADIVFADLASRADRALYRSKLAGRNRVTLEPGPADDAASVSPATPRRPAPLR
jgi:diguanylate cyclase (GGDEF)-like protein